MDNVANTAQNSPPSALRSRTPGRTRSNRKAGAAAHSRSAPTAARASQPAETAATEVAPMEASPYFHSCCPASILSPVPSHDMSPRQIVHALNYDRPARVQCGGTVLRFSAAKWFSTVGFLEGNLEHCFYRPAITTMSVNETLVT